MFPSISHLIRMEAVDLNSSLVSAGLLFYGLLLGNTLSDGVAFTSAPGEGPWQSSG